MEPRLRWVFVAIVLSATCELLNQNRHDYNLLVYAAYAVTYSVCLIQFIATHINNRTIKRVVYGLNGLLLIYGIIYLFIGEETGPVPEKFIVVSDVLIPLLIVVFLYDFLKGPVTEKLRDLPYFKIMMLVLLYHVLRYPYLVLLNDYRDFFGDYSYIITFFNYLALFYYLSLTYVLIRSTYADKHQS